MTRSCCHDAIDQCPYSRCHTAVHIPPDKPASWKVRNRFSRTASKAMETHRRAQTTLPPHSPKEEWWSQTGSNRRPHACKARALPTELWPHQDGCHRQKVRDALDMRSEGKTAGLMVVGLGRLERPTSPLSGVRSNHLSYRPETGTCPEGTTLRRQACPRRKRNEDGGVPQMPDHDVSIYVRLMFLKRSDRSRQAPMLRDHP